MLIKGTGIQFGRKWNKECINTINVTDLERQNYEENQL